MAKVLVTGDRGYIGAVLVSLLVKNRINVVGIDTEFFKYSLNPQNSKNYQQITKDIRDIEKKDLEGIDAIIHLAALSNDPIGELSPSLTHEINYKASIRLAEMAKSLKIKKFIFSSSCSVYGGNGKKPVNENDPVDPLTQYAKSKLDTEKELLKLSDENFNSLIMRNATVYGYSPKLRLDLVVNNLVASAVATGEIKLLSDGKAWRPLMHVLDLSRIFLQFLNSDTALYNTIYNVGEDKQNILVKDIADLIYAELPDCRITYASNSSADKRNYKVDFRKLKNTFPSFEFKMDIKKGVQELILRLRENKFTAKDFFGEKFIRLKTLTSLMEKNKIIHDLYWRE